MDAATAMRELCAGWERQDAAAIAALFADDGRYEGPLFGEFPVGPAAVEAACAAAFAELVEVTVPVTTLAATSRSPRAASSAPTTRARAPTSRS